MNNHSTKQDVIFYWSGILFTKQWEYSHRLLTEIIQNNNKAWDSTQPHFQDNGIIYSIPLLDTSTCTNSRANTLHPTLRNKFQEYKTTVTRFKEEEDLINGFFQRLLIFTAEAKYINKIVPTRLHIGRILTIPEYKPHTNEDIEDFIVNNEKYLNLIKGRLALNIIDSR